MLEKGESLGPLWFQRILKHVSAKHILLCVVKLEEFFVLSFYKGSWNFLEISFEKKREKGAKDVSNSIVFFLRLYDN